MIWVAETSADCFFFSFSYEECQLYFKQYVLCGTECDVFAFLGLFVANLHYASLGSGWISKNEWNKCIIINRGCGIQKKGSRKMSTRTSQ